MAYCFYNGVKLPELPSGVIANYPYCWIRKNDNTQYYDLLFTKILGYYDASLGGIEYGTSSGTTDIVHYRLAYSGAGSADGWDSYQTTNTWMALDANRTVMWSNHYIPNGSLTATEMYFDAHEAIPEVDAYQIEKETVVGIADQVRRLCNTEATMTPAVIKSNLEGLNIDLMETFVISGPEEQVIYPDEGYYGFSKITVGAVDTSGGGTGGDDWDSAEDTTFGDEYEEGDVPTGNYDYTGGEDENAPKIPLIPGGEYQILFSKKLKVGQSFRYSVDGESYDVKTGADAYLYAAYGWVEKSINVVVLVCSEQATSVKWKETTATSWTTKSTSASGDGYFLSLYSSVSTPVHSDNKAEFTTEISGIPVYCVGDFPNDGSITTAFHGCAGTAGESDENEQFIAFGSATQILYDGSTINNADGSPMTIYECDAADANTWVEVGSTGGGEYPVGGYTLVWNSHDLLDLSGQYVTHSKSDDPIAETAPGYVTTPVERNETYTIEGNTANSLMSAAQKVTGDKTPLTPHEAALALDEYQAHPAEEMKF